MNCHVIKLSAIVTALSIANCNAANAADLPKQAKILDHDCVFYSWPYPVISPDGNWVAYVSKGYVCVCNVTTFEPRRVMEVPRSWTWPNFVIQSVDSTKTGPFDSFRNLSRDERLVLNKQVTAQIHGIQWTYDSTGFVFGVQKRDPTNNQSTSDVYLASVEGKLTTLAHGSSDSPTKTVVIGTLTRDKRFLVSSGTIATPGIEQPLIWNIAENKPRATPFLYLTPSSTSGRLIGIEKDTRQLVIVDEDFRVIQRFNETRPERVLGFSLNWSPDERSVVWRNQIGFDHFSNWEGFYMDLVTGTKRPLDGRYMAEHFQFTGSGGEFIRCGADGIRSKWISGDQVTGAHLTIVPENSGPPRDAYRIAVDPGKQEAGLLPNVSSISQFGMSPDANLFAILLSRPPADRSGYVWHLIDRDGRLSRFPGRDTDEYVSPYELAGFAENGKKIIGYDATRIFSVPIASIRNDAIKSRP